MTKLRRIKRGRSQEKLYWCSICRPEAHYLEYGKVEGSCQRGSHLSPKKVGGCNCFFQMHFYYCAFAIPRFLSNVGKWYLISTAAMPSKREGRCQIPVGAGYKTELGIPSSNRWSATQQDKGSSQDLGTSRPSHPRG